MTPYPSIPESDLEVMALFGTRAAASLEDRDNAGVAFGAFAPLEGRGDSGVAFNAEEAFAVRMLSATSPDAVALNSRTSNPLFPLL